MSALICSFDGLHDNRVLRYYADFEAHILHMDTQTEAGEKVSVHLLACWPTGLKMWFRTTSSSAWMRSAWTLFLNRIKTC